MPLSYLQEFKWQSVKKKGFLDCTLIIVQQLLVIVGGGGDYIYIIDILIESIDSRIFFNNKSPDSFKEGYLYRSS